MCATRAFLSVRIGPTPCVLLPCSPAAIASATSVPAHVCALCVPLSRTGQHTACICCAVIICVRACVRVLRAPCSDEADALMFGSDDEEGRGFAEDLSGGGRGGKKKGGKKVGAWEHRVCIA